MIAQSNLLLSIQEHGGAATQKKSIRDSSPVGFVALPCGVSPGHASAVETLAEPLHACIRGVGVSECRSVRVSDMLCNDPLERDEAG